MKKALGISVFIFLLVACGGQPPPSTPPSVTLNASTVEGPAPLIINFTASASSPDNNPLTYNWVFGDGNTTSGNPIQTHVYATPGTYPARVMVTDNRGGEAIGTVNIRVTEPTAPQEPPSVTPPPISILPPPSEPPQEPQPPPTPPSEKPYNQVQTERMLGAWSFAYSIGTAPFVDRFVLDDVRESPSRPGEFVIFGTDEFNSLVVGGYIPSLNQFSLYNSSTAIEELFVFSFNSDSTVSGCYYITPRSTGRMSRCYPMTGVRTSRLSTNSVPTTGRTDIEQQKLEQSHESSLSTAAVDSDVWESYERLRVSLGLR